MKGLVNGLKAVYSLYAGLLFVVLMLLVFPFAVLASLAGRIRGGNMIYRLCRIWADCWFPLIGIFHQRIYEAPLDRKQSCIFVANHISYLDAPILCKACRQPIRPLGKVEMSRVPVFGFIYRNAIVTVDRSSPPNRARSVHILKSILARGISVMVFPEGTFNMGTTPLKSFYDGAFRVAIETQTPIRPLLFLDAYRRMPYESFFRMTPGRSRILYMEEVPVAGYTLDDVGRLRDEVYARMEIRMRTYGGAWRQPAVN